MGTKGKRGQILLDACLALPFILLGLGLGLDVVRRAQFQMAFHHAACVGARRLALRGATGLTAPVREALDRFGAGSSGAALGASITIVPSEKGREIRLHYRYPQFFSFPWRGQRKHHLEVSESCSFPTG